jgi:hypothetical protein
VDPTATVTLDDDLLQTFLPADLSLLRVVGIAIGVCLFAGMVATHAIISRPLKTTYAPRESLCDQIRPDWQRFDPFLPESFLPR